MPDTVKSIRLSTLFGDTVSLREVLPQRLGSLADLELRIYGRQLVAEETDVLRDCSPSAV